MNYLIIGAGAIGTYIGGSLLKSGQNVIFLEREELVAELRSEGIKINLEDGSYQSGHIQVYSDLGDPSISEVDVVIFAMKSFDTLNAARMVSQQKEKFKVVLCLQNGVENESVISSQTGADRVIGGSVTSAVERVHSGFATLERKRGIGIANTHPLSLRLVEEFNGARLNAKSYPNLNDMKWSKMLSNLLGNATSAILNMTPTELFRNPQTYRIECDEMREAVAVMDKAGIHPVNLPGVPMKLLLGIMLKMPQGISRPVLSRFLGAGRGGKMPSFHIDLHAGRKSLESIYLNGAVCRFGKELGVPTPVNDMFNTKLQEMAIDNSLISHYDHRVDLLQKDILSFMKGEYGRQPE